jgi:hypothetical protein
MLRAVARSGSNLLVDGLVQDRRAGRRVIWLSAPINPNLVHHEFAPVF